MKKLLLILTLTLACLAFGCASIKYSKTASDGTVTTASATSLFSNSALKGMKVDATTKTTTNGFAVTGSTTEPNPESITATGEALGTLAGSAAKAMAK